MKPTLPVSRAAASVGAFVFVVMAVGLPFFVDVPLWLIVGGSALNAALYVAIIEIGLSRIRQEALTQFDDEFQ